MNQIQHLNRNPVRKEAVSIIKRTPIPSLNFLSVCQALCMVSCLVFTNDKVTFIFIDKKTNPQRIKIISVQDHNDGKISLIILQSKLNVCYSCLQYSDFFKSMYCNCCLCIYLCVYLLPLFHCNVSFSVPYGNASILPDTWQGFNKHY